MKTEGQGLLALAGGSLAAMLASACCLGPVVLVSVGLGGAWLGNLALLDPYRPFFLAAAVVAMFFAWRRIYRPAGDCRPGETCAIPEVRRGYRVLFWLVAAAAVVAAAFPHFL